MLAEQKSEVEKMQEGEVQGEVNRMRKQGWTPCRKPLRAVDARLDGDHSNCMAVEAFRSR